MAKISKRLYMLDVARKAGYEGRDDLVVRRVLRHLRKLEASTGKKLVWTEPGSRAWTTLAALKRADPALIEEQGINERVVLAVNKQAAEIMKLKKTLLNVVRRIEWLERQSKLVLN